MKRSLFIIGATFALLAGSAQAQTAYLVSGIAKCSAPGTEIDFAMTGDGQARVARVSSNYDGFRAAAKVKVWNVLRVQKNENAMIVFDNGRNSRIMNVVGSQKSMGFLADGGVSDMLCQILVQAR